MTGVWAMLSRQGYAGAGCTEAWHRSCSLSESELIAMEKRKKTYCSISIMHPHCCAPGCGQQELPGHSSKLYPHMLISVLLLLQLCLLHEAV